MMVVSSGTTRTGSPLGPGTLYAALDRLDAEGLVEVDHDELVDGRNRRYYRLTSSGAAALTAEAGRLARTARKATAQLRQLGTA